MLISLEVVTLRAHMENQLGDNEHSIPSRVFFSVPNRSLSKTTAPRRLITIVNATSKRGTLSTNCEHALVKVLYMGHNEITHA